MNREHKWTAFAFQWGIAEHPQEDAYICDDKNGIFLVADGVTRTPSAAGYPNPSPAQQAAERLIANIHAALILHPSTRQAFEEACGKGNDAVRALNQELGLWDTHDYYERDLAGAVFSGLVLNNLDNTAVWGFMTDCGVAHLSPKGDIFWMTEDRLTPRRGFFPPLPNTKERQIRIRKEFRNNPHNPNGGMTRTFGVFTGEETAMPYLEIGKRPFTPGEVFCVFTDGMLDLVRDQRFRTRLCSGSRADIEDYLKRPEYRDHTDDKTIIIVRT